MQKVLGSEASAYEKQEHGTIARLATHQVDKWWCAMMIHFRTP